MSLFRVEEVRGRKIFLERGHVITALAEEVVIGEGVLLSPKLEIGLPGKAVERFVVGDNSRLYGGQIASRNFTCGDYVTIHEGVWAYGHNDITIGHNGWFGRRCTLDAEGSFWVGDNIGVGQDSHLWSHIRHGDTLAGNRWLKYGDFRAGHDVWFVGRCTSAPAEHESRSMAMVEANVTKGMPADTIWGGNPAKDLTEKLGPPFIVRPLTDRLIDFHERVDQFATDNSDVDLLDLSELVERFNVETRTYRKTGTSLERRLMRYLLPEAKFTPERA